MSESAASLEPAADPAPPTKAATIYDVAQAAGVSHQTVSRFLKGFEGIRPETREKVVRALDELGYRPNLTARSLKSGRSHRIGALTHEISQVGPSRIAEGANAAAREAGYVLDLISLDVRNPRAIEESLELITQHDLAGVLALASTDEMTQAFETTEFRVPAYIDAEADEPSATTTRRTLTSVGPARAHRRTSPTSATDASCTSPAPPRGRRPAIASGVRGGGRGPRTPVRRASCTATGRRDPATTRSPGSPHCPMRRRSSPRTTRWRSGPCSP